MVGRRWTMVAASVLMSACAASAGDSTSLPDGVALAVFRDRSGEDESAQFHDVPVLLVSDGGVAYMAPPAELAASGELLPDVWVQSITPAGIERVLSGDAVSNDFVPDDLILLAGAENLGPLEFYLPGAYLFTASAVDESGGSPVLEWPETASVGLAEAAACELLPENEVSEAFETAAAGSIFEDGGVLYRVFAKQAWPGATC